MPPPDSKKSPSRPVDNSRKKRLAISIGKARRRELLYIDTVLQSAESAAFQVLETRIALLEQRKEKKETPEPSIREFFLDVLLNIVFSQAGTFLKKGAESMLRPILRSRQAYILVPQWTVVQTVRGQPLVLLSSTRLQEARKSVQRKLKDELMEDAKSDDYKMLKVLPEEFINAALEKGKGEVKDQVSSGGEQKKPSTPSAAPRLGKAPTVEILFSVQEFYNSQKAMIESMYDYLEAELLYSDIEEATAVALEDFLDANLASQPSQSDHLKMYKEAFFFFYEACMWSHVVNIEERVKDEPLHTSQYTERGAMQHLNSLDNYELDKTNNEDEGVTYTLPLSGTEGRITDTKRTIAVPKRLLNYWVNHFPFSFDEPYGRTIFEEIQLGGKSRYTQAPTGKVEELALIDSYEQVLFRLKYLARDLENSWIALRRSL